jgi:hypothetical protein
VIGCPVQGSRVLLDETLEERRGRGLS